MPTSSKNLSNEEACIFGFNFIFQDVYECLIGMFLLYLLGDKILS